MEDNEMKKFSRTAFFLVTGFCFSLFNTVLQLLDRTREPVFTWIGIAALMTGLAIMTGLLNGITTLKGKSGEN